MGLQMPFTLNKFPYTECYIRLSPFPFSSKNVGLKARFDFYPNKACRDLGVNNTLNTSYTVPIPEQMCAEIFMLGNTMEQIYNRIYEFAKAYKEGPPPVPTEEDPNPEDTRFQMFRDAVNVFE